VVRELFDAFAAEIRLMPDEYRDAASRRGGARRLRRARTHGG